jgi:hypothetical protein
MRPKAVSMPMKERILALDWNYSETTIDPIVEKQIP